MKKAYFSTRIHKKQLDNLYVEAIDHALLRFNQAKQFSVNTLVKESRSGQKKRDKSLHLTVKHRFDLNDYYANSAVQEANAIIKSQQELQKMYLDNKDTQVKSVKAKIKTTKSRLTVLTKIKASFIKGKPTFNKTSREQQCGRFFVVSYKTRTDLYENGYLFEHVYLDKEIEKLQARLGNLSFRLDRLEKQKDSLKKKIKNPVFGSKKLFKAQHTVDTYRNDHELWRKTWENNRYNRMTISGRKDAKQGNFVFTYNAENQFLHFKTPFGVAIELPVTFPYGQDHLDEAVITQQNCSNKKRDGRPIAWSLEDHGSYYLIKCLIEQTPSASVNYSKSDGVIGIDCNVDHFAWSNINAKGQLIKSGVLAFDIEGKTSGQIIKLIEMEAITLVDIAYQTNKPIAIERLDTTKSKVSNPYGSKKANRKMSLFAYNKMITSIKNRAEKMGVAVFEINPAYTSVIGKMKYMKRMGISIHQAASFVIARRAMGFNEKLPPVLYSLLPEKIKGLHHWAQWKKVHILLSDIRTHSYYQSEFFDMSKFRAIGLFEPSALTEAERKGLGYS